MSLVTFPQVLVSAQPQTVTDDVHALVRAAGFVPVEHALGAVPPVHLPPFAAAVVCPSDVLEPAVAQTKRWRAELGDRYVPIVWVLTMPSAEWERAALDAGADACVARPFDEPLVVARLRALRRVRGAADRLWGKVEEAKALAERLQKCYEQTDRDIALARTIHRALVPAALPEVKGVRFGVHHRPRSRVGGDFFDAWAAGDDVEFFLADAVGSGGAAGGLFGLFVKQILSAASVRGAAGATPPGDVLHHVNRSLVKLALDDAPLVSMALVRLDAATGRLAFARAGLPHPIHVPAAGPVEPLAVPGPMLGVFEAEYPTHYGALKPGDKLLFTSDGTLGLDEGGRASATPVVASAVAHRALAAQPFADAVANDLLHGIRQTDDFTLLAAEFVGSEGMTG
jgi:serine phosphatase RsbU (regulator of sigma subunit)